MVIKYEDIKNLKISEAVQVIVKEKSKKPLKDFTIAELIKEGGLELGVYFQILKDNSFFYIGKVWGWNLMNRQIQYLENREEPRKSYMETRLNSFLTFCICNFQREDNQKIWQLEPILIRTLQPTANMRYKNNTKYDSAIKDDKKLSDID